MNFTSNIVSRSNATDEPAPFPSCHAASLLNDTRRCDAADGDARVFWFHGVFCLVLTLAGAAGCVFFVPVLFFLFIKERKNPRMLAKTLSEFYLLLGLLLIACASHSLLEAWEWSLRHMFYSIKVRHLEIRLYQDFARRIIDTIYIYLLVLITILRHRTTKKNRPLGLKRLVAFVVFIVVFAVVYILPTFFTKIRGPGCYDDCVGRVVYRLVKTRLRTHNKIYIFVYKTNLFFFVSLLFPSILLLLFNLLIVAKMRRRQLAFDAAGAGGAASKRMSVQAQNLQKQVFNVCLWVTVVFFVGRIPYFVAMVIRYGGELADDKRVEGTMEFQTFRRLGIFLISIDPLVMTAALVLSSAVLRRAALVFYRCGGGGGGGVTREMSLRKSGLVTRPTKRRRERREEEKKKANRAEENKEEDEQNNERESRMLKFEVI